MQKFWELLRLAAMVALILFLAQIVLQGLAIIVVTIGSMLAM